MLLQILVDNLWRQIDPDVKNTVLLLNILERIDEVLLSGSNDLMRALEVVRIPLSVGQVGTVLASLPVGQEMIEKLNTQDWDVFEVSEYRNVDMLSAGNVQKHTVKEEQEGLNIQVLAPGQAEVKEELTETFVLHALCRQFVDAVFLLLCHSIVPFAALF